MNEDDEGNVEQNEQVGFKWKYADYKERPVNGQEMGKQLKDEKFWYKWFLVFRCALFQAECSHKH